MWSVLCCLVGLAAQDSVQAIGLRASVGAQAGFASG